MNKVIYVEAYFQPVGKEVTVKVATGEVKKGFFGGQKEVFKDEKIWEQTGLSDCVIDGKRLTADIGIAVTKLNDEGYEVFAIESIISGAYDWKYGNYGSSSTGGAPTCFSYGYGFSYTSGVTIIAKKHC